MQPSKIIYGKDITFLVFPQEQYRSYRIVQYDVQSFTVYHLNDLRQMVWEAHNEQQCKDWIDSQIDHLSANKLAREFLEIATRHVAHDIKAKKQFHQRGKKLLLQIARDLGYHKDACEVRNNTGGIAVSGEIILHVDDLYVQFSQNNCVGDMDILYRDCLNRHDYSGGSNQFMSFAYLHDYSHVLRLLNSAKRKTS